ncbi:MAG: ABC transporter permease [Ktedonobacteraceae bacterium]|jgi:oligopeptide transport system permease protein
MDTKDLNPELSASGLMAPDSTSAPAMEPELAELASGEPGVPVPGGQPPKKSPTPLQDSLRRLRRDKRAMVSLGVVVLFVVIALIGPFIYQHIGGPYNSTLNGTIGPDRYHTFSNEELDRQDELPSAQYWLGTDDLGRDILARLMQGMLISLAVAILVEVLDVVLGVSIGVLAGYYGGWIDQLLARFTDIMFAFPGLLFAILLTGIFGGWADDNLSKVPVLGPNGNARLLLVSVALAFTTWPLMARYVRGQTLQLKQQQFVEAARTSGTTDTSIILKHIVPNLFSIVVVVATLDISGTIIGEAGLSYLGLGVKPPGSSIGLMISAASEFVDTHPWEVLVPCVVLAIIVLAFSFFGDGLRDAFDPRSKD